MENANVIRTFFKVIGESVPIIAVVLIVYHFVFSCVLKISPDLATIINTIAGN